MTLTLIRLLWRRHRLALLCSFGVPILIGALVGLLYPQLQDQREAFEAIPFIRNFWNSEFMPFLGPGSIFALPYQHPLTLILYAVFPAVPVLGLPAGERGRGGLDLLLATPLERRTLIDALAAFVVATAPLIMLAPFLGALLGGWVAGETGALPVGRLGLAGLNAAALLLFWCGVVLVVSVLARDRTSATLAYAVVIVVTFATDSAARLARSVKWLEDFTPYGYFRPADVVGGSTAWLPHSIGLALAGAVLVVVARELQQRRRQA